MNKKWLGAAVCAFILYCAAISVYKTWEAEKKRREAEKKAEETSEEENDQPQSDPDE